MALSLWGGMTLIFAVVFTLVSAVSVLDPTNPHGRSPGEVFRADGLHWFSAGLSYCASYTAPVALVVYGVGRLWARVRRSINEKSPQLPK